MSLVFNKLGKQYMVFNSVSEFNCFLDSPHSKAQLLVETEVSRLQHAFEQPMHPASGAQGGDNLKPQVVGYCAVCKQASPMTISSKWGIETLLNFREWLVCKTCGLNNRQRLMMAFMLDMFEDDTKIYIQEQITFFYKALIKRFANSTGSEFIGDSAVPGAVINSVRHEDCMNLSFGDASFDAVVSQDVFEHIPDIHRGLSEIYRVLLPNGYLVFTMPFHNKNPYIYRRSSMDGHVITHHMEPEYHGNPLSEAGSLVFYDFGIDFFDIILQTGFRSVHIICSDDFSVGHYGRPSLFLAIK